MAFFHRPHLLSCVHFHGAHETLLRSPSLQPRLAADATTRTHLSRLRVLSITTALPSRTARSDRHLPAPNARRRPASARLARAIADWLLPPRGAVHRVGRAAARRVPVARAHCAGPRAPRGQGARRGRSALRRPPARPLRSTSRALPRRLLDQRAVPHARDARALRSHARWTLSHVRESPRADRPALIK